MSEKDMFQQLLETYGVLGVFAISFLGNTIPYSTIPYLIFIIIYSSRITNPYLHILITVAGGVGAALGKVVVYYIGRTARVVLKEDTRRNMELFVKIAGKGLFLAIFIFAALPLPDDILYVPVGISGYNVIKFFIALVLGKTIITGAAVFFGRSLGTLFEESAGIPWYISIPVLLLITILLTYIVAKINWIEVAEIGSKKGFIRATIYVVLESLKIVFIVIPKGIVELFKKLWKKISRLIHH